MKYAIYEDFKDIEILAGSLEVTPSQLTFEVKSGNDRLRDFLRRAATKQSVTISVPFETGDDEMEAMTDETVKMGSSDFVSALESLINQKGFELVPA